MLFNQSPLSLSLQLLQNSGDGSGDDEEGFRGGNIRAKAEVSAGVCHADKWPLQTDAKTEI